MIEIRNTTRTAALATSSKRGRSALDTASFEWDPRVAYEAVGGDGNVFSEQGLNELCAVHEAFHLGPESHRFCRRRPSDSSSL